jgi:hypothetical protein
VTAGSAIDVAAPAEAVTAPTVHAASRLPILPVEYGLTNAAVSRSPAVTAAPTTPGYSADEAILSIRVMAVRKRIHLALTEIYLRVKAAREEMLSAVQVGTGGGKWADGMLRAVTEARVDTNKAVALVEQANAIVTQLNEATQDARTLTSGLLQVHDLVLQGWKWLAVAVLDCEGGAKEARDEALHSGALIRRAQTKASEHLLAASKHLKGAGDSCWGSLGDEASKEKMASDRAKLLADFSVPSDVRNVSDTVLHSIAEQKLLPFSAGAGSMQGPDRDLRRVVRYQEREMSWTPCFQDLCKALGAVERSGCMWGCLALVSVDHMGVGTDNFAGFCAAHARGVLTHTAEDDLVQLVGASNRKSMAEIESSWANACRHTCVKRKASPTGWGSHGGVLDGSKPSSITVEEEAAADGGGGGGSGGLAKADRNSSAALSQANLRAGDKWTECDGGVCAELGEISLSRSGCLNGCRAANLGGVQHSADCPMWCEETVDQVLADPETLGQEATRDLPADGAGTDDARAKWVSACHVGCKSILEHLNKGQGVVEPGTPLGVKRVVVRR